MSIAVAVKCRQHYVLAADTKRTFAGGAVPEANLTDVKIRKVGTAYMATTGWGLYGNILDDYLAKKKSVRVNDSRQIFTFFRGLWTQLREHYSLVNEQSAGEDSPFGDLDASFLLITPNGIFYVACDMSVTRFDQYYAIGSGGAYGLGALHAMYEPQGGGERIATRAVEAACDLDVYCGGRIDVVKVKVKPTRRRR